MRDTRDVGGGNEGEPSEKGPTDEPKLIMNTWGTWQPSLEVQ